MLINSLLMIAMGALAFWLGWMMRGDRLPLQLMRQRQGLPPATKGQIDRAQRASRAHLDTPR